MKYTRIVTFLVPVTLFSYVILRSSLGGPASDPQGVLPLTQKDVEKYVQYAEQNVQNTINNLVAIPAEEQTFANTMDPWNRLAGDLLVNFSTLTFVTQADLPSKSAAIQAMQKLQSFLFVTLMQNKELSRSLLNYTESALYNCPSLSGYEHYVLQCLLESCEKNQILNDEKEKVAELKALNIENEQVPFIYKKGSAQEKSNINSDLSILTLNTCFLPGKLTFLWGGVASWKDRLSSMSEKILSSNADVVCLQEVFYEDAAKALYEKLKGTYAHFYFSIGPRPMGLSLHSLGFSSGLFVASKYPMENPAFTLYKSAAFPMNYGAFDFVVKREGTSLAHIYTTHLQALDMPSFPQVRASQLQQVIDKMQSDSQNGDKIPYFLCGDLNIPLGRNEPSETMLKTHFIDSYSSVAHSGPDCTCTDYFIGYFLSSNKKMEEIDPNFRTLDYALLLNTVPREITTSLVRMNRIEKPKEAVSDHHGLLTIIK